MAQGFIRGEDFGPGPSSGMVFVRLCMLPFTTFHNCCSRRMMTRLIVHLTMCVCVYACASIFMHT